MLCRLASEDYTSAWDFFLISSWHVVKHAPPINQLWFLNHFRHVQCNRSLPFLTLREIEGFKIIYLTKRYMHLGNTPSIIHYHYNDVIMSAIASPITSLTIVYSTVYSMRKSKKTSKLRVTGLCAGNSPVTGEFPAQRASNVQNVSIWWRHHDTARHCCGHWLLIVQ